MGKFVSAVLGSTEAQWSDIFAQAGKTYQPPTSVLFSRVTRSACGVAQSAMGPFYCPNDQKVYLDPAFCDIGSKSCQFSQAYVIAHGVGHHVQNLLGVLPKVQEFQGGMDKVEANQLRVELQADCLAGVWANHAEEKWRLIEPGDVESAMQNVIPDAFTHGTSAQRTRWFLTGLKSGEVSGCDTFRAVQP
jgi:predicted metalloprotease